MAVFILYQRLRFDYELHHGNFLLRNFERTFDVQNATFGVQTRKFQTAVYPPRMAPIGFKLCQNAFQTIPDVSFFDVKKNCVMRFEKIFGVRGKIFEHGLFVLEELDTFECHQHILHEK